MLMYCPTCANLLTLSRAPSNTDDESKRGKHRYECRTCPYQFKPKKMTYQKKRFTPKQADDILGGSESLEMFEKTNVPCKDQTCDSEEAYVRQVQIRSADEGMTSFFTCCKCLRRWQEN